MNDLTDTSPLGTENLATPDNCRNCAAPDTGNLEPATPATPTSLPLAFTVVTGTQPDRLTKVIGLNANGSLRKETSAMLSRGRAQRVLVEDLNGLKSCLDALTSAQAVTWGVTQDETVDICTQGDTEAQQPGAMARTRENFRFAAAPGVMMLDHDGLPDEELSPEQLRDGLITAVPALADAPMLWRPSASAGCVASDGSVLSGLTRHRLYIPVIDAALIPAAGKALEALLWAMPGGGWCDVGVAGQRLPRCLVDVSVWQPERLDFAGPPVLVDGVTRVGVEGVIFGNAAQQFDLRALIDSATPAIKKQAQAAVKEQAERVGMPYVNERWLGGMLTNFQTVAKRISRLRELELVDFDDVAGSGRTKKELLMMRREKEKLERTLGGIRDMGKVPSAIWIVDTNKEHLAVAEAHKLNIPVVAILDTNCDPDDVSYSIPGNDDAIGSVGLLTRVIADAVAEGLIARGGGAAAEEPMPEWEREVLAAGEAAAEEAAAEAPAAEEAPAAAEAPVAEAPAVEAAPEAAAEAPAEQA